MSKPLVTIVLGTRPEAIKLAPVIRAFQQADDFRTRVVLTGQHREMVSQVMALFGLTADHDLALMAPKQTLTHITCGALQGLQQEFGEHRPDLVLVQGDTTTAFASALAAFYEQIPVGHV
ncbi:MAG: UDP-N-acetylglucosamine 2-epimerase (non-hydrolyzing), partial [Cyanobium sp. Baikal-G2]